MSCIIETAANRIGARYQAKTTRAFPIAIITAIISAVMTIIQNCANPTPTPAPAKEGETIPPTPQTYGDKMVALAKENNVQVRYVVTNATMTQLREQFGPLAYFKHDGPNIVESIIE